MHLIKCYTEYEVYRNYALYQMFLDIALANSLNKIMIRGLNVIDFSSYVDAIKFPGLFNPWKAPYWLQANHYCSLTFGSMFIAFSHPTHSFVVPVTLTNALTLQ